MTDTVEVTQADNDATVKLTEWLIMADFLDEDGPPDHQRAIDAFGEFADQLFARHRLSHTPAQGDLVEAACNMALRSAVFEILRRHDVSEQCFAEIAATTQAALSTNTQTSALSDVIAERQRQVSEEGWTPEHDDEHDAGQMAVAAGCYALASFLNTRHSLNQIASRYWPWDWRWWKPKGQREDLIRAGALILAEIERIDRKSNLSTGDAGHE